MKLKPEFPYDVLTGAARGNLAAEFAGSRQLTDTLFTGPDAGRATSLAEGPTGR